MSTELKADSIFQLLIETFADDFGIVNPAELETQAREIVPEFVQMDAVVVFPDGFDFTTLNDKIFPFLGKYGAFEYKAKKDPVTVMRFCQYSLIELGILARHFLSKERKDRKERDSLSQQAATEQWQQLSAQGATHSCSMVILSTTDPRELRKKVGFKAVTDYAHLEGALYRLIILENEFVGSIATYIVVLKDLPLDPKNGPLLLLAKGKKQEEFCRWLIEEDIGLTEAERQLFIHYLFKYRLIQNPEVELEMKRKLTFSPEDFERFFDDALLDSATEQEQAYFMQKIFKKWFGAETPLEASQKLLGANSPLGVAQKALQAGSPIEVALKAIQSEEQRRELIARLQQTSYQTQQAAASA